MEKAKAAAFQGDIKTAKKAARANARLLLKGLSAAEREEQSQKAAALFLNSSIYKDAECVAAFFSLADEVDIFPIIARAFIDKKRVLLPRIVAGSNAMDFYELAAPLGLASDFSAAPVLGVESVSESAAPEKQSVILPLRVIMARKLFTCALTSAVIPALDAGIFCAKDCRVKPGNDTVEAVPPRVPGLQRLSSALFAQTEANAWGIREPLPTLPLVSKDKIPARTAILVPGLAFCKDGRRLGRGKGFYDRYLSELLAANPAFAGRGKICGYCMARQIMDNVPTEENDVRVQALFC